MPVEHADIGLVAEAQGTEQLVGCAQHLPCGVGGLEPKNERVGRTDLLLRRFRSGDGVFGEFMKSAHRDGGIRDGEPDGLEVRQWFAELHAGAHMLGDDMQRLLHCSQNPP